MPAILPKHGPDEVIAHGLKAKVKYVRLVRRKLGGKNRFYAQLICEGLPYQKPKNKVGQGVVGVDLGPSTIAVAAPDAQTVELRLFCAELESQQKQIRVLQHKLDRQRRSNNPQNYNKDGTVKKGKKAWQKSKKYEQTQAKLAYLHRKQADRRKSLHGQLVNHIFSLGNEVKLEKLSYRAFQRRYGKSVGFRAPGMFVSMLKRKAVSAGVSVTEFTTRTTKLSQVCLCGQVKKKSLSQRWHVCECGVVTQRDLFSAFLAACVEDEKLNAERANELWRSGMDACLRAALGEVQPASGGGFPASFGFGRRQSGSPVSFRERAGEGRGAVASELMRRQGREPGNTCPLSGPPVLTVGSSQPSYEIVREDFAFIIQSDTIIILDDLLAFLQLVKEHADPNYLQQQEIGTRILPIERGEVDQIPFSGLIQLDKRLGTRGMLAEVA